MKVVKLFKVIIKSPEEVAELVTVSVSISFIPIESSIVPIGTDSP